MDNNNISVAIIDDDIDFIEILQQFLKKIGITKLKYATSFEQGKLLINKNLFDLVLLDIDLSRGKSGIELAQYIRTVSPDIRIIFLTNNFITEYYELSKSVKPSAFLDKEINELKIQQAIELALLPDDDDSNNVESNIFSNDFVFIKVGGGFKKVFFDDIDYIVYAERYANLVVEGKKFPLNITMKDLAKNLPSNLFMQVHQSYIVNVKKITYVNSVDNELEVNGKSIPIGISFRKALQTRLTFLT